jgi:hypothetical protein
MCDVIFLTGPGFKSWYTSYNDLRHLAFSYDLSMLMVKQHVKNTSACFHGSLNSPPSVLTFDPTINKEKRLLKRRNVWKMKRKRDPIVLPYSFPSKSEKYVTDRPAHNVTKKEILITSNL